MPPAWRSTEYLSGWSTDHSKSPSSSGLKTQHWFLVPSFLNPFTTFIWSKAGITIFCCLLCQLQWCWRHSAYVLWMSLTTAILSYSTSSVCNQSSQPSRRVLGNIWELNSVEDFRLLHTSSVSSAAPAHYEHGNIKWKFKLFKILWLFLPESFRY